MKILKLILAVPLAASCLSAANAATTTANFNVTANLNSKCEVTTGPADVAFAYTSFQTGAATSTGGAFGVRCTNTLPYTLSLDASVGTVIGLNYTLSLSAAGGTGAGLTVASYTVNGSMVANQSGTCATTAVCSGTDARVLTVNY